MESSKEPHSNSNISLTRAESDNTSFNDIKLSSSLNASENQANSKAMANQSKDTRDQDAIDETTNTFKTSNSPKSSISDISKGSQEATKPMEDVQDGVSSTINSNFELKKEWEILLNKIKEWIPPSQKDGERNAFLSPTLLIISLITFLGFVKAYTNVLSVINEIPLAPGLFKFFGTMWLLRFSTKNLLHKADRQEFIFKVKSRSKRFLGQ